MIWKGLGDYIDGLQAAGELVTVKGADCDEDIGGITELMTERNGPGLLFEDIPGYPAGYRVASNLFTTARRTAFALGLKPDSEGVPRQWRQLMCDFKPVPVEQLETGPIFENVLTDKQIDLYKFPTPKWHELDGGRYIGTGVCVINRDQQSGIVNVGAYRVCIVDERTCSIFIEHGKHGYKNASAYWERGEKCPVVLVVGQEPVLTALAGPTVYHTPRDVSELEVAGYIHRSPYPVVCGKYTDLPIPAYGEIAIEGFIPSPAERLEAEGPFGEWTGYYAHGRRPELVIEVSAIYHRNNPIIFGLPPERPVGCNYNPNLGNDDFDYMERLEKAGIPGIGRVVHIGRPNFRGITIKQMYPEHVDDVIKVVEPGGDQYCGHNIWILVDDDIDLENPHEVIWALASRLAPEHGVKVIPGTGVWQLDPLIPPNERSVPDASGRAPYTAHNLVLNACRPYSWLNEFPPIAVNSRELRQKIEKKWSHIFQRTQLRNDTTSGSRRKK